MDFFMTPKLMGSISLASPVLPKRSGRGVVWGGLKASGNLWLGLVHESNAIKHELT